MWNFPEKDLGIISLSISCIQLSGQSKTSAFFCLYRFKKPASIDQQRSTVIKKQSTPVTISPVEMKSVFCQSRSVANATSKTAFSTHPNSHDALLPVPAAEGDALAWRRTLAFKRRDPQQTVRRPCTPAVAIFNKACVTVKIVSRCV